MSGGYPSRTHASPASRPLRSWPLPTSRHAQAGFNLVELSAAFAILGLAAVITWATLGAGHTSSQKTSVQVDTGRAREALTAYAQLYGRLPCPAPDTSGVERCDGSPSGRLPFVTIGLPMPSAGRLLYQVSMTPTPLTGGSSYQVLVVQKVGANQDPTPALPSRGQLPLTGSGVRLLELCAALASSAADTASSAYVIQAQDPQPAPAGSPDVTPTVNVGKGRLAAQLGCASMSAGGRAHFNAAAAASMMRRSIDDQYQQYELGLESTRVDLEQGVFFGANAAYGTGRAVLKARAALAEFSASNYTAWNLAAGAATATAKVPLQAAHAAALASNIGRFSVNMANANAYRAVLDEIVSTITTAEANAAKRALLTTSQTFFMDTP